MNSCNWPSTSLNWLANWSYMACRSSACCERSDAPPPLAHASSMPSVPPLEAVPRADIDSRGDGERARHARHSVCTPNILELRSLAVRIRATARPGSSVALGGSGASTLSTACSSAACGLDRVASSIRPAWLPSNASHVSVWVLAACRLSAFCAAGTEASSSWTRAWNASASDSALDSLDRRSSMRLIAWRHTTCACKKESDLHGNPPIFASQKPG
eukprot:365725-Chlamydomonas_euryale.AAC.47